MGQRIPKREEVFGELEDTVKDAVLVGSSDAILMDLLDLTIASINERRPLFQCVLDEPAFYRKYFKRWVEEALEEYARMKKVEKDAQQ